MDDDSPFPFALVIQAARDLVAAVEKDLVPIDGGTPPQHGPLVDVILRRLGKPASILNHYLVSLPKGTDFYDRRMEVERRRLETLYKSCKPVPRNKQEWKSLPKSKKRLSPAEQREKVRLHLARISENIRAAEVLHWIHELCKGSPEMRDAMIRLHAVFVTSFWPKLFGQQHDVSSVTTFSSGDVRQLRIAADELEAASPVAEALKPKAKEAQRKSPGRPTKSDAKKGGKILPTIKRDESKRTNAQAAEVAGVSRPAATPKPAVDEVKAALPNNGRHNSGVMDDPYVLVSKVWPDKFKTYPKFLAWLKKNPQIRRDKRVSNRQMIHAADLANYLAEKKAAAFADLDNDEVGWEVKQEVELRTSAIRAKKARSN